MPIKAVENNASTGRYSPMFFDLEEFNLGKVEFNSLFFTESDVESQILKGNYSFAYLREDKLRTIDLYISEGEKISKDEFLTKLSISVQSKNLFKTGKYLSRICRPTKYAGFYKDLKVHYNDNPEFQNKCTDGISIISLELAKNLGWSNAQNGKSAQFTLFSNRGLVKGHCVISSKITCDAIIWTHNVKEEIRFTKDCTYVSIEPVKISDSVKMDIQSLLNLWGLFGEDQYFSWAKDGIEKYKNDLVSGKLAEMLDDFDDITPRDYEKEAWTFKKAIWHKIDYTRFPGLMRLGWQMFRKSILHYAERKGTPVFRIPVPSAYRGYLRCDLRNHDNYGNFTSVVPAGSMHLDKYGNLWFNKEDAEEYLSILGGADQDDSVVIIPIEDNKAVVYRNPNQYGEYLIVNLMHDDEIIINAVNKLVGHVTQIKPRKESNLNAVRECICNPFIEKYLSEHIIQNNYIEFTQTNLLRTYSKISANTSNIGIVANAEMIRSAIGINDPDKQKELNDLYPWNLERVIDSVVKDGISCSDDLSAVENMYKHIIANKYELPTTLLKRLPESKGCEAVPANNHKLDELFEAVKFLVKQADLDILGEGSASRHNRINGLIDQCNVPLIEIGTSNLNNPMNDCAQNYMGIYNRKIGALLGRTSNLPSETREIVRSKEIEQIQRQLLQDLNCFSTQERIEIIKSIAYNIYKGQGFVHDSILWISDKGELNGTADIMIEMIANMELAAHVNSNDIVSRFYEKREPYSESRAIRVWSKSKLSCEHLSETTEILISQEQALIGETLLNIGEEVKIEDGIYLVKSIAPSISRKNGSILSNSLTIYLS